MKRRKRNPTPKKGRCVISFGQDGVVFVTPRRTACGLMPDRFFELTESLEDITP